MELRYTRNGKPFVRRIFTDGADLLKEAAIERFELEAQGWAAGIEPERCIRPTAGRFGNTWLHQLIG